MKTLKIKWEPITVGWHCSPLGGICKENTGRWHCYVLKEKQDPIPSKVSFTTLKEAKRWFEREIKMKSYKVYGPVQDGMFSVWHVIGPRGGFIAEFFSKKAANEFIRGKGHKTPRKVVKVKVVKVVELGLK
jgi:hypothetical protein